MSRITVWFIKCAMVYFLLAISLGVYMVASGGIYPYLPIHAHFNLLGWMSMMIYGVSYHILPRFSGRPLWSDKLAEAHFWLANIGLVGISAGWILKYIDGGHTVLLIFSFIEALAIIFFVINMFKTIKSTPPIKAT
ncbi:MAG: cbb3-type cytochrome c oxidase subunit I [Thermodesulfobacteriota bacterium]